MQNIVRDMKRHTSIALRNAIKQHPQESRREWMLKIFEQAGKVNSNNTGFQLWRQDNHPIELSTAKMLYQKLDYIHNNPVEAGFVESADEYLYSSAKCYYGLPSFLLDIKLVEQIVG